MCNQSLNGFGEVTLIGAGDGVECVTGESAEGDGGAEDVIVGRVRFEVVVGAAEIGVYPIDGGGDEFERQRSGFCSFCCCHVFNQSFPLLLQRALLLIAV